MAHHDVGLLAGEAARIWRVDCLRVYLHHNFIFVKFLDIGVDHGAGSAHERHPGHGQHKVDYQRGGGWPLLRDVRKALNVLVELWQAVAGIGSNELGGECRH